MYVLQGERGGLIHQLCPSPTGDPVFSLNWLPGVAACGFGSAPTPSTPLGLLASSGADRAIVMTDPRKWHTVSKWQVRWGQ